MVTGSEDWPDIEEEAVNWGNQVFAPPPTVGPELNLPHLQAGETKDYNNISLLFQSVNHITIRMQLYKDVLKTLKNSNLRARAVLIFHHIP